MNDLFDLLPKYQVEKIFNQEHCDIDASFLGFTDIYKKLSEIIPKHFTIIDLGCAYNAQCFYFTEHKKYISVDISDCKKFKSDNCIIYEKSIVDYIKEDISTLNLTETFAICSYIPSYGGDNGKIIRETFKNLFVFYPNSKIII